MWTDLHALATQNDIINPTIKPMEEFEQNTPELTEQQPSLFSRIVQGIKEALKL